MVYWLVICVICIKCMRILRKEEILQGLIRICEKSNEFSFMIKNGRETRD